MKVSVILPSYNEAGNITEAISLVLRYVPNAEIIVVDDDSPDKTWSVVKAIAKCNSRVKLIRRVGRRGIGSAVQEGFEKASGNRVVWLDCDLQHPPSLIPQLLEKLDGYDMAVASRYVKGGGDNRSFLRCFLSLAFVFLAHAVLGTVWDYTSGMIAVKREVLEQVRLVDMGSHGCYFTVFLYRALRNGFSVVEVPYVCIRRKEGATKFTVNDISKYLSTLIKLRLNRDVSFG